MSYDFHGGWDQTTGAQAPLYNKKRSPLDSAFRGKLVDRLVDGKPDDFTVIRGNQVWNDPFNEVTGPYPHKNAGVDRRKLYTGFSTYGRGWTLPTAITGADDPNFAYGIKTKCHPESVPEGTALPSCCPGCNSNFGRKVTKENGITTLYDLEEDETGVWNAAQAFRKFDEGTVTAYAASGDQFISYDTWETLALKAVWVRDEWLAGTKRMSGNGRYGGAIVWSIDTDDFNNAMPHHWAIACYLESNYYLSKTPMCQCRFWKRWAKKSLPGSPTDIDSKFVMCNTTLCDPDNPMGTQGTRGRRTTDAGKVIHHHGDSHSRIEHNRDASAQVQRLRVAKHENEIHHHRQSHILRRKLLHAKHGRHLDTDRRHLTADSVGAAVHECSLDLNNREIFNPPPFVDNCASDISEPGFCPASTGNIKLASPTVVRNSTTNEPIGTLPSKMKILSTDTPIGDDQCMMKYNRTWYFIDACYNMAHSYQTYYKEDLTPPPLRVYETRKVTINGVSKVQSRTAPAEETCAELLNGVLNETGLVNGNGKLGCPKAEEHYKCYEPLPPGPIVNASMDQCSPDLSSCPGATSSASCLPPLNTSDGESLCPNWRTPISAPCPRLFTRSWSTSDQWYVTITFHICCSSLSFCSSYR